MYAFPGRHVSNPSRDYSAFLRWQYPHSLGHPYCFKPFQGLFRVSTWPAIPCLGFLYLGFKPFQGLFRVSTPVSPAPAAASQEFQTLPGIIPRFYAIVPSLLSGGLIARFKPFQGLFRVSTKGRGEDVRRASDCFKPFQGLFRVST
ncbi:hypothetical protein U27_01549 [Candidatus Vecturithrix granuli]|uniref:Uncharacterized protein n=1 Tax=Vecturithrix granuli TaxID=1499967 RepID=A0A081CAP3_VECG1|nr:hypothetical protein U27_01549 [Candidatus Vecturithrix granuli]